MKDWSKVSKKLYNTWCFSPYFVSLYSNAVIV